MSNSTLPALGWGSTPEPPYHVAIFTSQRSEDVGGFEPMAERMVELVRQHPGFLAMDSAGANGIDIVISYWKDEESIVGWKQQMEHLKAQKLGRQRWMKSYQVRIGKVERAYGSEVE
ncbi:MAG TPA: antibiotic biosynthesis monooxygenase [Chthoniobacterales bacterium]